MTKPRRFDDLTLPGPGSTTLRDVLNLALPTLVRDFRAIAGRTPLHARVRALVEALVREDPRRVVRVLRRPTVAGLLGAALRSPSPEHLLELDLLVLLGLAAQGDLPEPVEVSCPGFWPVLRSIEARGVVDVGDPQTVLFENGRVRADGRGWDLRALAPAYLPLTSYALLATTDNNPLAHVQQHPERLGNELSLDGRTPEQWREALGAAFALLETFLPELVREMRLLSLLVVPVGYDPERHFSCSYEDLPGAIYLSLHPNVMTLAEAIVHEFQHNKLHLVMRFDPLLSEGGGATFRSPVRPDPRPLKGVLLAVHAFHPVAMLYERMTAATHPLSKGRDWGRRFADVVRINREGATTVLEHARPTSLGAGLFEEMRRLERHFEGR